MKIVHVKALGTEQILDKNLVFKLGKMTKSIQTKAETSNTRSEMVRLVVW